MLNTPFLSLRFIFLKTIFPLPSYDHFFFKSTPHICYSYMFCFICFTIYLPTSPSVLPTVCLVCCFGLKSKLQICDGICLVPCPLFFSLSTLHVFPALHFCTFVFGKGSQVSVPGWSPTPCVAKHDLGLVISCLLLPTSGFCHLLPHPPTTIDFVLFLGFGA